MVEEQTTEQNKGKVLLVDDDPLIIRMYQKKLSNDGFSVSTAFNGEEAMVQIMKDKPDVVLLDVMMPKMNGVETLKAIKEKPETANIPVIFLTNLGDSREDMESAKQLGVLEYLVKADVKLSELSLKVGKAISDSKGDGGQFEGG